MDAARTENGDSAVAEITILWTPLMERPKQLIADTQGVHKITILILLFSLSASVLIGEAALLLEQTPPILCRAVGYGRPVDDSLLPRNMARLLYGSKTPRFDTEDLAGNSFRVACRATQMNLRLTTCQESFRICPWGLSRSADGFQPIARPLITSYQAQEIGNGDLSHLIGSGI